MITNDEYITEYITSRGLSQKTYNTLKSVINHYCKFQEATIYDLITEADNDEENGVRWKRRKLKTRLTNYMNHLRTTMDINSAKTYFSMIKTFYQHHEIEIGKLPNWNLRNSMTYEPITYADLPDTEIIRNAVNMSRPLMKSIIMFLASSGMSKVDMRTLTIQSFIDSTTHYHHADNIIDAVNMLSGYDGEIIPVWKHRRSKTNKYFITFNTGEATRQILNYLQIRLEHQTVKPTDKLFPINEHYFTRKFEELNDAMGLGKVGAYNRFRGHMLRKFHATQLAKAGMDKYTVNVLQGKSNGRVNDVYFFEDADQLKNEYLKYYHGLLIFTTVEKVDSPEVAQIKNENKMLRGELDDLKNDIDRIKKWWKF